MGTFTLIRFEILDTKTCYVLFTSNIAYLILSLLNILGLVVRESGCVLSFSGGKIGVSFGHFTDPCEQ